MCRPVGINAFVYMAVARLVHLLHPQHRAAGIPAQWLAKGFVFADIISFTIQAAGGAMLANQDNPATVATGQKVYMVGVGVQMGFVTAFMVVALCFHRDVLVMMRTGKLARDVNDRWVKPLIWAVYAVLVLITVSVWNNSTPGGGAGRNTN